MTPHALYLDDQGRQITTNSMIKTFHRCPKQTEYKYIDRLKPRVHSKPLTKGKWMHSLLEAHYKGESWTIKHKQLATDFNKLFDEEKEALGDLPGECAMLMRSYLWHYGVTKEDRFHGWKVLEVEKTIDATWPDGTIYRGRVDMLIEDEFGIWLVDHKNHRTLPDLTVRMLDMQSVMYIWAAWQNGIPVQGFIWNYLRTKAPTIPQVLKDGSRLSKRAVETDYPTLVKAIQNAGLNPTPYREWLDELKSQRWQHGVPQTSPFFRRDSIEKSEALVNRVVSEAFHAKQRMDEYSWEDKDTIERVPDRSCKFQCSYTELCGAELFGSGEFLRRKSYIHSSDPLDYYNDDPRLENNE